MKPNNAIKIPCNDEYSFFRNWMVLLKPYHNLSSKEIDVAASYLTERYHLSKAINDINLLNEVLMNEDTKRKVRERCKISLSYFQVVMSKFRKTGFIVNNTINSRYIPSITESINGFTLLFYFLLDDK